MQTLTAPKLTTATLTIGQARIENRAPSHDGEYITIIKLADDGWIAVGNGGVICGDQSDWFEGEASAPGYDEMAVADAISSWDFEANPDQFGFEARDLVSAYLSAPRGWGSVEA
jgi:hypothetical protein